MHCTWANIKQMCEQRIQWAGTLEPENNCEMYQTIGSIFTSRWLVTCIQISINPNKSWFQRASLRHVLFSMYWHLLNVQEILPCKQCNWSTVASITTYHSNIVSMIEHKISTMTHYNLRAADIISFFNFILILFCFVDSPSLKITMSKDWIPRNM